MAIPLHPSSTDRTREWQACCHDILMGRDPKQQCIDDEVETPGDDDNRMDAYASPGCLALTLQSKRCNHVPSSIDSWMETAMAMSDSIDTVSATIQEEAAAYTSRTDILQICFAQQHPQDTSQEMTNADRSILETTVASFAAGMTKQIDSLRQAVIAEGDHPLLSDNNEQHNEHPIWSTGPIGHRAAIATCLMQRLKVEIMEPMTQLSMVRESKNRNSEVASSVCQNPLKGFTSNHHDKHLPPAPWEIGEHDLQQEKKEREEEREEFLNVYQDENLNDNLTDFLDAMKSNGMPPTIMQIVDLPKLSKPYPIEESKQPQTNQSIPSKPSTTQSLFHDYQLPMNNEEEETQQLQRESAALLATYQQSDLKGVQHVERSMIEITQLLSRFTDLISEQQENILMIHDQAVKSKENVEKGQDQLVDAAKRGETSRHPMATFIVCMAFLLLLLNGLLP